MIKARKPTLIAKPRPEEPGKHSTEVSPLVAQQSTGRAKNCSEGQQAQEQHSRWLQWPQGGGGAAASTS